MFVIGSIPGPVKGDVDLHEPASVGTLGPVSVDAGVQEHVSIPGSVSVDVPGPVSVDFPAGPVNVELPMIEFNGNSGNYDDKIIIIILIIIIIGGMIYTSVQGVTDSAIPTSAHIDIPELQEASNIHGPLSADQSALDCHLKDVIDRLACLAGQIGLPHNTTTLSSHVSSGSIGLHHSDSLRIHNSFCSWSQYYPVLSFLMSGHLYADYDRLSGLLGLPACSNTQWSRIVKRLEEQVTELAKWSCGQVQQEIIRRGGAKQWTASCDGFYQTRGHYSNNSSATLHDFSTGKIAYFAHRTKRGPGHNWSGTSAGAEANTLDELLGKVRQDRLVVQEMVSDKDTSVNATFCRHFPEGNSHILLQP